MYRYMQKKLVEEIAILILHNTCDIDNAQILKGFFLWGMNCGDIHNVIS